jgi:hypothetical protein
MKTSLASRGCKSAVITISILAFSLSSLAQSRLVADYNPTPGPARDLNSSLAELLRVAPATGQDLDGLHEQGKLHWVTFWKRDSAHSAHMATALRRNLQFAVPNLIHDTQTSGGSISSTFKLYKDLNVVCESLDSLVSGGSHASKPEYAALGNDLSDLNRIKEDLSSYIQQTASSLESNHPELISSAGRPKKIIIDDNIPDKPRARKHRPSNQ